MSSAFTAKVSQRGTVWASMYVRQGVLGYKMEHVSSRRSEYRLVEPILVQPAESGTGWDILLYGDIVHNVEYKRDAQREAERLLDNPRDTSGYLIHTTGYYANQGS